MDRMAGCSAIQSITFSSHDVDLEEFKRLYAEGFSDRKISKALGFSKGVSARVRSELGLAPNQKRRKNTAVNFEEFKRLHGEGLSERKIGKALGFSQNISRKIRNEQGLAPNRKRFKMNAVDLGEFQSLHAQGLDDREISKALGFSPQTVRKIRDEIGLPPQPKLPRPSKINETEFLKYYQQGKSTKEIASHLHVHFNYMYAWMRAHKYSLNPIKYTTKPRQLNKRQLEQKRRCEKRLELYNKGLSDAEIAAKLDEKESTVKNWRRYNKLLQHSSQSSGRPPGRPPGRPSKINEKEFLKHYQQRKTTTEIASQLQVTYNCLHTWMKAHNYKANCKVKISEKRPESFNKPLSNAETAALPG
jgi:transposase